MPTTAPAAASARRAPARFALRPVAPARHAADHDGRQQRHVRGVGRHPGGAGRLRHRPRRGLAALHPADDRLRCRRRADGPAGRPLRRDVAAAGRCGRARAGLRRRAAWRRTSASFIAAQAVLVGLLGSSATFAPLVADTSLWFVQPRAASRWRSAPAATTSRGAIWPPIVQHFVETVGWRQAYLGLGVFCGVTMLRAGAAACARRPPVALTLRPSPGRRSRPTPAAPSACRLGTAQALLCVAGVACCVAMAMPQVHIVAYCADLGYGAARGAADAVAHAGLRHRQPAGVGLPSATASAGCARCCWARRCSAWRCCCSCPSTGSCRSSSSRRCSACSRAASCPPTPSSCASISAGRGRGARRHGADVHAARHGARRLDVGQGVRPDRLRTTPPSSTASRGTC